MNLVQIENKNGNLVVSSRVVAEQLGKEHKRIMQDCRDKLEVGAEFVQTSYIDSCNREQPEFMLTKDGFILLCMNYQGYNDFKRAYINEFNRMERELTLKKDSYMIEDPVERAKKWIAEQEEKKALQIEVQVKEQVIQEYKPRIEYLDTILNSQDTMTVTQIAADYGISAKRLNQILHDEKMQRKVGGQWLLYTDHMNRGYTRSETTEIRLKEGKNKLVINTKWTQKGRVKIHEILTELGIVANMDREKIA
ncbi:phage regulatory protein/antirepressor Ant [uncultured Clostridium sp.]|uniref:phage regulatory protein/antirepressor Ant n=1 Tax=uncultured Clostridium sp. TaxID=59620 RepID=UPI0026353A9C|nr:phage regulatory protein/antirepressor Ant [uncultured Clostridium sp.]